MLSFRPQRILQNNTQTKTLVLLGSIDEQQAIVSVEKSIFTEDFEVEKLDNVQELNSNDVYSWNTALLTSQVKVNIICPASETHVQKYSEQKYHMVKESPLMYREVVHPYIQTQTGSRIQWVHNILYHGKEKETFVHHSEDPLKGYVLVPDMKWDRTSLDNLYLVAIVKRTDLASIRDLDGSHVEYLQSISSEIQAKVFEVYGLPSDQLRLFVHYQPSYYHFHIHIVNIGHPGLGDGLNAGKAILLDDIVENLRLDPAYYQKRTLVYQLGENHQLWTRIREKYGS